MSTETNEKILDKVRKLRALAESANVHEAAAAAAAAERLIQEHNLSEAALHVGEEDEGVVHEGVAEMGSQIPTWQANLLAHLSKAYQCSGFYSPLGRNPDSGHATGWRFVVYGRPSDLATLRYQYAYFSAEITRLAARETKGRGRTYANSYRLGAVHSITESIGDARRAARAQATSSALVVVDRREMLAKARRNADHPNLRNDGGGSSNLDAQGFLAGKRAGAGINQRSQIGAGGTRLLGGGGSR